MHTNVRDERTRSRVIVRVFSALWLVATSATALASFRAPPGHPPIGKLVPWFVLGLFGLVPSACFFVLSRRGELRRATLDAPLERLGFAFVVAMSAWSVVTVVVVAALALGTLP